MWKRLLLLFLTSACLMTVELVAGRLVVPYLGNSLYTWTSIIGACLSGMSFGHLFGGWLADRQQPQKYLGILLINAALLVVATLPFTPVFLNSSIVRAWHPLAGIFVPALMLFGLPCFFMASVSPLVYRLALQDLQGVGGLLGRLSASGVVGSIAGTYLTGFWLIPSLGVTAIVVGAAALLGVLGFLNMPWARISRVIAALIVAALVTAVPFRWPTALAGGCDVESAYFCIRITTSGGAPGAPEHTRHLVLDRLIHSGYQPASPDTLWYDYEQLMAWVIQSQEATARNVLFLGGGGYVLPRWMERHYPDTSLEVIEIDPAVTKVALEQFMPGPTRIKTVNGDARQVLYNKSSNTAYDLVIGDAFTDYSVPSHLTTVEFVRVVRDHLTANGLYLLNVIDAPQGAFRGAMATTLEKVFPHVGVQPRYVTKWELGWEDVPALDVFTRVLTYRCREAVERSQGRCSSPQTA